jgi:hypothetical protein
MHNAATGLTDPSTTCRSKLINTNEWMMRHRMQFLQPHHIPIGMMKAMNKMTQHDWSYAVSTCQLRRILIIGSDWALDGMCGGWQGIDRLNAPDRITGRRADLNADRADGGMLTW